MVKTSVPLKIVAGYVAVITVLVFAVWLVYSNTKTFERIDKTGRESVVRRDIVDSLVYCFLEMSNSERAICLGKVDEWDGFDVSLRHTLALADTLRTMVGEERLVVKIDSLRTLLAMKRSNTLQIIDEMAAGNSDEFFRRKVNSLHRGSDSVVIHPKAVEVNEEKEIVYNVIKSKKGFFARLADAFRKQRSDTVAVSEKSRKAVNDSVSRSINIADTVADVLEQIKLEEIKERRTRMKGRRQKEQTRQIVGVGLARGIGQLLEEIRNDEHIRLKTALDADVQARRVVMMKIMLLAAVAVLSVVILLYYVLRDIRRARVYQENLKQAKAETERVMVQRERLLLTITHDIKAPAASISGFIELLGEHVGDVKALSYLRNIKSSATHLLGLVGSLLDYHRLESGKVEIRQVSFSARRLVESCVESMRPQALGKGLELQDDTSGCAGTLCRGDAFRIKQVLDNLIGNAVKYTDKGSVCVKAAVNDGRLTVEVADTGCGMAPDEVSRIFNAFTRLPEAQGIEGVGLGLSITKEIVTLLGGRINVESEKGRGTLFRVSIPVGTSCDETPDEACRASVTAAGDAAEDNDIASSVMLPDDMKVLILDDDRLQLRLLEEMLARISGGKWKITACSRAADAMRMLDSGRYDMFFIDIEMPGTSGVEIAGSITDRAGMKLIAITAHEPSIMSGLLEAGFDACLFKPFSIGALAGTLSGFAGNSVICGETETEQKTSSGLDALTAYAGGDEDAEREILESFAKELDSYIGRLGMAVTTADRDEIAGVAHKALPVFDMIGSAVVGRLKALLPENIGSVDDALLRGYCDEITNEMKRIKELIRDRLQADRL